MLRVGTCAPAPLWRVTQLVVGTSPGTIIASESLDSQHLERALMEGTLDAAIMLRPLALPGFISQPIMTESLSVLLPSMHPLAAERTLRFQDIDGETFLVYANIGFWRSVVVRELPRAEFLWQEDRSMFEMLLSTSDALAFSTEASEPYTAHVSGDLGDRVAVPLSDASAHATFYLVYRTNERGQGRWARRHRRRTRNALPQPDAAHLAGEASRHFSRNEVYLPVPTRQPRQNRGAGGRAWR